MTAEEFVNLACRIRNESASGNPVMLEEVWQGTEAEFLAMLSEHGSDGFCDLELIRRGRNIFVYSEKNMSRAYAEAAAGASCSSVPDLIAEAVRYESAAYPRPMAIEAFTCKPYSLPAEEINAALEEMSRDSR